MLLTANCCLPPICKPCILPLLTPLRALCPLCPQVIGKDREKDIAVLQIQGLPEDKLQALRPVQLGSSSNLLVGQKVYAIGNPFGLDQTLTQVRGEGRGGLSSGCVLRGCGCACGCVRDLH